MQNLHGHMSVPVDATASVQARRDAGEHAAAVGVAFFDDEKIAASQQVERWALTGELHREFVNITGYGVKYTSGGRNSLSGPWLCTQCLRIGSFKPTTKGGGECRDISRYEEMARTWEKVPPQDRRTLLRAAQRREEQARPSGGAEGHSEKRHPKQQAEPENCGGHDEHCSAEAECITMV